jgi:hypothetical protein
LILHRIGIVDELTEEQVATLSEVNPAKEDQSEGEGEDDTGEGGEGFTKDVIMRRLRVDLEHVEKILCAELIREGENGGEIDGGGDDQGGGGKMVPEDLTDDSEFQDAV